jgi:hypothetical protein
VRFASKAFVGVGLVVLVAAGVAQASGTSSVAVGTYAPKSQAAVDGRKTAYVDVIVIDHGKKTKQVSVGCQSSAADQAEGVSAGLIFVVVPGHLPIKNRAFSYSGVVKLESDWVQPGDTVRSHVSIKGKFSAGKIKLDKTIALKGTVSASVCSSYTSPTSFSLVWGGPSTAT